MQDAEKVVRYPAKETAVKHERIVKEASRLFRERGFENVSVGEVMKAAGLTHRHTEVLVINNLGRFWHSFRTGGRVGEQSWHASDQCS
jgi:Bacterial regulatory proteins, tetR family